MRAILRTQCPQPPFGQASGQLACDKPAWASSDSQAPSFRLETLVARNGSNSAFITPGMESRRKNPCAPWLRNKPLKCIWCWWPCVHLAPVRPQSQRCWDQIPAAGAVQSGCNRRGLCRERQDQPQTRPLKTAPLVTSSNARQRLERTVHLAKPEES